MRFNEIKLLLKEDRDLLEINMSPSNLEKLAAQINAQAGMEFEMIVPDVSEPDLEPEYERDDDRDTRTRSFSDVEEFFYDGDYNGRNDIRRLMVEINEAYQEWRMDQLSDDWVRDGVEFMQDYISLNDLFDRAEALDDARDQVMDANPDLPVESPELQQLISARLDEMEREFAAKEFEDQGRIYNDAFEAFLEEQSDSYEEEDFLRDNYPYMSDIESSFDVQWPYYIDINDGQGGDADIEYVADEFSTAIGRKTNWSSNYHGGKREPNTYVVEPDGSLDPDDRNDAGLEFVSPPLSLEDMLGDLDKVKAWADKTGCYTNKSTGLHINVSVENFDLQKLDYVKLALLLGDQYVLDQFGRAGNMYAKSAMGMIKERIAQRPEDAAAMLQQMKAGLGELATKVIHSGATSKYTSINTKTGYVEFRSPGGNWLSDEFFNKIKPTLLRFVVALDAAMDPQKYRDEYLKKLYAVLKPKDQNDTLSYFAKFAAGELPKVALKSFIRQAQLERKTKKAGPAGGTANYKIYNITDGRVMNTFYAADRDSAESQFRDWLMSPEAGASDNFRYAPIDTAIRGETGQPVPGSTLDLQRQRAAAAQAPQTLTTPGQPQQQFTGEWKVMNVDTGQELYRFSGAGNSQSDANGVALEWIRRNAPYTDLVQIEVVPVMSLRGEASGQPQQQFTGEWRVLDPQDREIYRFSGVGNSQSDANRVAMDWLRRNPGRMQAGVTVVPVMG